MAETSHVKLLSDERHWTLLMISQPLPGNDLVASGNKTITWSSVYENNLHHMVSLGGVTEFIEA